MSLSKGTLVCKATPIRCSHTFVPPTCRYLSIPQIWHIAEETKHEHKVLPERPLTSPGEVRKDITTKKFMTFNGFEKEYGWFADSVWETSKKLS